MRAALGAVAPLFVLLVGTAQADAHCYELRNDSSEVVSITFSYQPPIGNVITGVTVDPGRSYPFDGRRWCWNLPEEVSATVSVSAPAAPQWKGTLVLGNRTGTAPSGTYVIGPASAAAPAPAAAGAAASTAAPGCLANSFPNSDAYCLTGLETGIPVECGSGHTGISGTLVADHLSLQCRSGRKLKLTCGKTTGGRQKCDLNDHEICTDDHIRSAADYCGH